MELQLKNIGMIKEANIKLDGLTVIAGENNTGKSSVGKLLFSITKASSRYKEDLEEDKEAKILNIIEKNYFLLRRNIDFSKNVYLRRMFFPPEFKHDIDENNLKAIDSRIDYIKKEQEFSLFSDEEKEERGYLKKIENNLIEIKKLMLKGEDRNKAQKRAFKKAIISEFKGKISNENHKDKESIILIKEGDNLILDAKIYNNDVLKFNVLDDLYYNDATFIESPVLLQLSDAIDNCKTYFEDFNRDDRTSISIRKPNIPLHIKDLNDKLKISFYEDEYLDIAHMYTSMDVKDLLDNLSEIIGGRIKYIKKERDFSYVTKNGTKHNSINTATGIKSFGIIQMLLKSALIDERSLLILDEPEVHLHPKWQLAYAELVVLLVKNGINILVTSHSPYMIEALDKYSDEYKINNITNFYLAENEYIKQINNNNKATLSVTFEKLSEPFEIFEDIDRQRMEKLING